LKITENYFLAFLKELIINILLFGPRMYPASQAEHFLTTPVASIA